MAKEDKSLTQADMHELCEQLAQQLVNCQDASQAPHASSEERAAARWLYEQLVNYKGMLRKRPLLRKIEFITRAYGPAFSCAGTGWYYQPIKVPGAASLPAFNWIGPFPSHHAAELDRVKALPKTKVKLELAKLLED